VHCAQIWPQYQYAWQILLSEEERERTKWKTDQEHIQQISITAEGKKGGLCVMVQDCLSSTNEFLLVLEISVNTLQNPFTACNKTS